MRSFWIPILITVAIWVGGALFYWEIRSGGHYVLTPAERVDAYLALFTVASALTGSIFLIYQHWLTRAQLLESMMPRLFLAVLHNPENSNPNNRHKTSIKYINITDNDFHDLEIKIYGSANDPSPKKFLKTCKKSGFVQGRDERELHILTDEIFDLLGTNLSASKAANNAIRIKVLHKYTFMKRHIYRPTPVYKFSYLHNSWEIDE